MSGITAPWEEKKPADEGGLWKQLEQWVTLPDLDHGGPLGP